MSFFGGRRQQTEEETSGSPIPPRSLPPASEPAPPPRQPVGFETVLGARTTLTGDFRGKGNARLDGILEGTLEIDGNVLIGESAQISADIHARNISIAGAVRGNVHGNKVQILRTGRVWGDINAAAITTEEGAFIDGKIAMVSHEAALHSLESPEEIIEEEPEAEIIEAVQDEDGVYTLVTDDGDDDGSLSDDVSSLDADEGEDDDPTIIDFSVDDDDDLPIDEDGVVG